MNWSKNYYVASKLKVKHLSEGKKTNPLAQASGKTGAVRKIVRQLELNLNQATS